MNPALTIQLPGGVPMSFQRLPTQGDPEPFRMGERGLGGIYLGSSDPVLRVRLTQPFHLGTFPVTQAQFRVWTRAEGIEHENHFKDGPDHPAENMDWFQATRFCQWLTRSGLLPGGWWACLPTEAEWEYACRAGTNTEYYTGDGEAALAEAGWFGEEWDKGSTHPVGLKAPNAFGLHDMHGNVWEWCHDLYEKHALCTWVDGVYDPSGAVREADYRTERVLDQTEHSLTRVLRGGSWGSSAGLCRSACRIGDGPVFRSWYYGFRVCLVPGPLGQPERGAPAGSGEPATGVEGRGTRPEAEGAGQATVDLTSETMPRSGRSFFPKQ